MRSCVLSKKGSDPGFGAMSLLLDFGAHVIVKVHTDVNTAIDIVRRPGLGKLSHINMT